MVKKGNIYLIFILVLIPVFVIAGDEGWIEKKSMPTPRAGICAAVLNGKIYVMGGQTNDGQIMGVVERYDPLNDSWETGLPPMEQDRSNAAAVVYEGKLFVMGGKSGDGEVLKEVEFFDPKENRWESFSDLHKKRQGLTAVVLDNVMYALGGSNENDRLLNNVEYYDENKGDWRKFEDWKLEQPRASFASVVIKDSVFSIGGFTSFGPIGNVQRYHPTAGTTQRKSLLIPRGGLAATTIGDTIYVLGGRSQGLEVLNSTELFVPQLNSWQQTSSLNIARENCVAEAVNNKIFAIGGRDAGGNVLDSVEELDIVTSVNTKEAPVPADFRLEQNYPNPFNAGTKIKFRVSSKNISKPITLNVYNLRGQLISILVQENLISGEYEIPWNGTDHQGFPVASGIYIYMLKQGQIKLLRRMTLIR